MRATISDRSACAEQRLDMNGSVVEARYGAELKAANSYLMTLVHLDSKIEIGELISILVVLSPTMTQIFRHGLFKRPEGCSAPEFQLRVATLIMGARRHGHLACLSAIISGQVDADKLDYMPRDAHHSGMPISFDTDRLLHRLEIVRCSADTLPRRRITRSSQKIVQVINISI